MQARNAAPLTRKRSSRSWPDGLGRADVPKPPYLGRGSVPPPSSVPALAGPSNPFVSQQRVLGNAVQETAALPIITAVCDSYLRCLRVSQECEALLGYSDDTPVRSLHDIIHPDDSAALTNMCEDVLAPFTVAKTAPSNSQRACLHPLAMRHVPPALLVRPHNCGLFFSAKANMRLRLSNRTYDHYSVRMHLGADLNAEEPTSASTVRMTHVVVSMLKLGQANFLDHPSLEWLSRPLSTREAPFNDPVRFSTVDLFFPPCPLASG